MTIAAKDPAQYPLLRNLQFSPIKEGEEQYVVLWDPSRLEQGTTGPAVELFFHRAASGRRTYPAGHRRHLSETVRRIPHAEQSRAIARRSEYQIILGGGADRTGQTTGPGDLSPSPFRPPQFAGRSYEADAAKLRAQIKGFFTSKEGPEIKASEHAGKPIKGLVAPTYELKHAGPIYAWAYKELQEAQQPDLYVLIGTAHSGLEQLVTVTDKDFETPLGIVKVERSITDQLRERFRLPSPKNWHTKIEHASEFQLPFLQESLGQRSPSRLSRSLPRFQRIACAIRKSGHRSRRFFRH